MIFDLKYPLTKLKDKYKEPCKGIFFRYTCSNYIKNHNSVSIEFRQSLRLLKRRSCSGCDKCQQLWEDFSMSGNIEDVLHLPKNLIDNAIYEAIFKSGGVDIETGYCDDWWWELKKVE